MRYRRNHPEADFQDELQLLGASIKSLPLKTELPSLLGPEGRATAVYFRAYGKMFTKELRFEKRSRRPPVPKDLVNSLCTA